MPNRVCFACLLCFACLFAAVFQISDRGIGSRGVGTDGAYVGGGGSGVVFHIPPAQVCVCMYLLNPVRPVYIPTRDRHIMPPYGSVGIFCRSVHINSLPWRGGMEGRARKGQREGGGKVAKSAISRTAHHHHQCLPACLPACCWPGLHMSSTTGGWGHGVCVCAS